MQDYYEILEISRNASLETIKGAYRALCKKYHPDTCAGDKNTAETRFKIINEAHEVLSNPSKKREYDRSISVTSSNDYNRNQQEVWENGQAETQARAKVHAEVKTENKIVKLSLAGMFLALCMVLPMLTGQIPQIGKMLGPMHIPVLLCGFICGWQYGLAVGFIAPLLRFAIFGMPIIFPTGLAMAFELAVYGLVAGLLYSRLPKKIPTIYVTLIAAMLCGRLVWGVASYLFFNLAGKQFSFAMFLSGAFTAAVPGIILHIILIPLIVIAWRVVQPKVANNL